MLNEVAIPRSAFSPLPSVDRTISGEDLPVCDAVFLSSPAPVAPFSETPPASTPRSPSPSLRVRGLRSGGVPRESPDAPEDLPKQAPRQAAFGQLQRVAPGMSDEAPAGLGMAYLTPRRSTAS